MIYLEYKTGNTNNVNMAISNKNNDGDLTEKERSTGICNKQSMTSELIGYHINRVDGVEPIEPHLAYV